jgi:hypothetical protein
LTRQIQHPADSVRISATALSPIDVASLQSAHDPPPVLVMKLEDFVGVVVYLVKPELFD